MKQSFLNMRSFTMLKGALMTGLLVFGLASCSEKDLPNAPEEEEGVESIAGVNVKVINDADELSKYVTNYKNSTGMQRSRAGEKWSMPELDKLTPDFTIREGENIDYNAGGNYVVPEGTTLSLGWITLNSNKGYSNLIIYGDATIDGINMNDTDKVYVAPGGKLTLKSEYCFNTSNKSLYIYAGGEYVGSYRVQNGASIYVEGELEADGEQVCGGNWYAGGPITVKGKLFSDNAHIIAPSMTIEGDWYDQNNAYIDIENFIDVKGNCTFRCQSEVHAHCLMVEKDMELTNAAKLNIQSYIKANKVNINASGWQINMGGDALMDCGEKLFIQQNGGVNIFFDNDATTTSVIKAKEIQGNVQDYDNKPSLDFMCIKGYVDLQYESRNSNCEQIRCQETVTQNAGVVIEADSDGCKPAAPSIGGGDNPPLPPYISEVVAHIDGDHTHDISATCIALNNGKAYISWHKRGTSIHGCIEALSVVDDQATLTSWMETETGKTEGGNNWDGNSAVSGADELGEAQGEYDFNHIIVVNENSKNYVVTVGDNASKGGFIGAIALNGNGDFGKNEATFIARQLLGNVTETFGRSGNAVVRTNDGNNGKYLIACAGGFQEYTGLISELGTKLVYENSGSSFWKTKLGDYKLTNGSAKHIALNGDLVATLEFTERSNNVAENDDYWFNDVETVLPATIKVRNADSWLNSVNWSANIEGGIRPIYGKNAIAMDADGNVYVSEGVNGLGIYNNGSKKYSFSIKDYNEALGRKYANAAVNGLCIDDNYIYLAYGNAGLWILDKNTREVVSYYTKGGASANYVAADDKYIYLAYGRNGVKVLKLND